MILDQENEPINLERKIHPIRGGSRPKQAKQQL